MNVRYLCWLICAAALINSIPACAEIPLVERAAIQLSGNGPWDVQHWMSDSTYGWAQMSGDTIVYKLTLQDSLRAVVISQQAIDSLIGLSWDPVWSQHDQEMTILRLPPDGRPGVIATIRVSGHWGYCCELVSDLHILLNLADGANPLICGYAGSTVVYEWQHPSGAGGTDTYTNYPFVVWPPLPSTSTTLLIPSLESREWYTPGDNYHYATDGITDYCNLVQGFQFTVGVPHGVRIVPFVQDQQPRFVVAMISDESLDHWNGNGYDHSEAHHHWISTYRPGVGLGAPDSIWVPSITAFSDSVGNEYIGVIRPFRVITADGYVQLWSDSTITQPAYSGLLNGSANERLLVYESTARRFRIYDILNGQLLDRSESLPDTLAYLINRPARETEFVTFSSAQRVVRMLTTAHSGPTELTCEFVSGTEGLQLHWQAAPGTIFYQICSSQTPDGPLTVIAEVPGDQMTVNVPRTLNREFFCVVADYTGPAPAGIRYLPRTDH